MEQNERRTGYWLRDLQTLNWFYTARPDRYLERPDYQRYQPLAADVAANKLGGPNGNY